MSSPSWLELANAERGLYDLKLEIEDILHDGIDYKTEAAWEEWHRKLAAALGLVVPEDGE